jgi:hypothetical protein
MDVRTKALWTLTAANMVTAILFYLAIFGVMLALAVIAPTITGWPFFAWSEARNKHSIANNATCSKFHQ